MDLESPNVEINTRAVDQRVQNLIQQARQGDVEAYYSLALCYRDGDGVEKSLLNMICMYAIYSQKTGGEKKGLIQYYEQKPVLKYEFEGVKYDITISKVFVFPQCYSAKQAPSSSGFRTTYCLTPHSLSPAQRAPIHSVYK